MFGFGNKAEAPAGNDGIAAGGEKYVAVGEDGLATVGAPGESKEDVVRRAILAESQEGGLSTDEDRAVQAIAEQGPITEEDVRAAAKEAGVPMENNEDIALIVRLGNEELEGGESDRQQAIANAIKKRMAAKESVQVDLTYTVDKNLNVNTQEEK